MKNKKIYIGLILIFFVVFLYYNKGNNIDKYEKYNMYIEKFTFSDDAQQILNIIDDKIMVFNYKVDKSIKFMKIKFFKCEKGEWDLFASNEYNLDLPTRREDMFGIKISDDKVHIIEEFDKNSSKMLGFQQPVSFKQLNSISSKWLAYRDIEPNKEIVLFEQYGYIEKQQEVNNNKGDFKNNKCDKGLVITVTFFDNKIGEK